MRGERVSNVKTSLRTAVQSGDFSIPLSDESHQVRAFITWTGFAITDPTINLVALVSAYLQEVSKLACGECGLGYNGVHLMAERAQNLALGQGSEQDIAFLKDLSSGIHLNARCDFCRQAVKPVFDSLNLYEGLFQAAVTNKAPLTVPVYIKHVAAPCMESCPIHQDVPGYIELTRNHRYNEALEVIRRTNCLPGTLGRTCVAWCEKNCVRRDIDQPLSIRALKRVPADLGVLQPARGEENTKRDKVAVIGSGPAGLAAAQQLSLKGYQVHILDEQAEAGGMTIVGIPPYRLPRRVIAGEAALIESQGVQIKFKSRVTHAEDLMLNVKAVIVTTGAHKSKDPGIANWSKDIQGLIEGVKYLAAVNSGQEMPRYERVIIIGGGNTAVDCARTALRLGSKEVTIVYRRSRVEMPARADEVEAAEQEGVKFHFLALPDRILAENNRVTGAECQRMELGEPDTSGRRRPVPVKGSEFLIPADLVLTAISESPDLSFLPKDRVALTDWGSIKADEHGRTSLAWLFAAGDCVSGPASIVEAMATGMRAAQAVELYLNKKLQTVDESATKLLREVAKNRKRFGPNPALMPRQLPSEIMVQDRIHNFDEVEQCFAPDIATMEGRRCLRCYRVVLMVRS
jgi:formate dehydrogenase beta subunit